MFVKVLIAVLLAIQVAGMLWAVQKVEEAGEQPFFWKAFLVICWPVTWLIEKIGVVQ